MIVTLRRELELINMTKLFLFLYECDEALFPETHG